MEKRNIISTTFHNIFTTNSKWQVVISCYWWTKNSLSDRFKLKPITVYHIEFVVKV